MNFSDAPAEAIAEECLKKRCDEFVQENGKHDLRTYVLDKTPEVGKFQSRGSLPQGYHLAEQSTS